MVGEGEKGGAGRARGYEHLGGGGRVGRWPGLGVGALHTLGGPPGRRLLGTLGQGIVEPRRHADLAGPVLPGMPTGQLQKVGAGPQGVGRRGPDVDASVAVDVDALGQVFAGLELGLAHGPGP